MTTANQLNTKPYMDFCMIRLLGIPVTPPTILGKGEQHGGIPHSPWKWGPAIPKNALTSTRDLPRL